ncbi:hypothetical protein AX14_011363 [Amanita brunnescens Koide BX004]|nr:hypothetical protein AX14_011363 [Amanita brunnescens Koide BX004]
MTTGQSIRDEEAPLLHTERPRGLVYRVPFPWFQVSILFALQTARYTSNFAIGTFIPDFVRRIGVAKGEKDVGYYVGLLISMVYAAEMVAMFRISQLSDQIGRKFVFLTCTISLMVFVSGFGLSTTFWELMLCQALIGAFRATRGVTRSMLAEMTDPTDLARGIAYYETSRYIGGIIGPIIGGSLSRPAEQFPQVFGLSKFLKEYPYFLPCAVCSVILLIAWLVGTIFLRETLKEPLPLSSLFRKKTQKDDGTMEEGNENDQRPLSLCAMLVPGIIVAAFNLSSISLLLTFFSETEVLYLSTPIKDGGLGLSLRAIGTLSSISAVVKGISQSFIFPPVHNKWGSRYLFVLGLSAAVPQFMMWPFMNWIARRHGYGGLVWFAFAIQTCCSVLKEFGCLAISVFIAQSYGSRAAVIGFCETVAGVSSAVAPAISNSLFSLSIDKGYLGGNMVYFVFVSIAALELCATLMLPDVIQNQEETDQ